MGCESCGYETGNHGRGYCSVDDREEIPFLRDRLRQAESENEKLRADVVWAVRSCAGNGCMNERIIYDADVDGPGDEQWIEHDGTEHGLLSAVRRAREGE